VAWGFNYDQRIEDWWNDSGSMGWPRLVQAFDAMHAMHANTVRVLLQFDKFVDPPSVGWPHGTPNQQSLDKLSRLVELASSDSIYLDITGLGMEEAWNSSLCTAQTPPTWCWYDGISNDSDRWAAQAVFWTAIAHAVAISYAPGDVAWFDLMNEPAVPSSDVASWCAGSFGGYCYTQYLTKYTPSSPATVTAAWAAQMVNAIHAGGSSALVSAGLIMPWPSGSTANTCDSLRSAWGEAIRSYFDFVSIHVYPTSPVDPWTQSANNCSVPGKPLAIEETMTLNVTGVPEQDFIQGTRRDGIATYAAGDTYSDGQLVAQAGYVYQAVLPITSSPPGSPVSTAEWKYLYRVYQPSQTYSAGDLVLNDGLLFTATRTTAVAPPSGAATSNADWDYSGNGPSVSGWLGFYVDESQSAIASALTQEYYSLFTRLTPLMQAPPSGGIAYTHTSPAPPPPSPHSGYDLVGSDGGVFVFPSGQSTGFYGSLPGLGVRVNNIVGMVPSPDDRGYFLVGSDGGVFAFGNAPFVGSLPGLGVRVNNISGIVPTSDNRGYFLVGSDGGVFAFGDAPYLGSLPGRGIHINDVIGIAATPSDLGYWVVAADGSVYAFGNAPALGSALGTPSPVSGIASTPDGAGYWIVSQNGSVYPFGDAGSFGSLPALGVVPWRPVIGLVPTADDHGYWLIGSDGGIFAFSDAPYVGSLPGLGGHITNIVGAVPTKV